MPTYTAEKGFPSLEQFLLLFERHAVMEGFRDPASKGLLLLRHLGPGPMADINTWLEGEEFATLGVAVNFGHYCSVLRSAASDPRVEARAWASARNLGDRSHARSLSDLANAASQRAKASEAAGDILSPVDLYYALLHSLTDEEYRLWIASWQCQEANARRPPSAVAESPAELRARCTRGHTALVTFCKLHTSPLGGSRPAAAPPAASTPPTAASPSARAGSTRGGFSGGSSKRHPGPPGGGSGSGTRRPATAAAVASATPARPAPSSRASSRAPSEADSNSESDTPDLEAEAELAAVTTDHPTPKYFGSDAARNSKEFKRRKTYGLCFCCIPGTHRHTDHDDVYLPPVPSPQRRGPGLYYDGALRARLGVGPQTSAVRLTGRVVPRRRQAGGPGAPSPSHSSNRGRPVCLLSGPSPRDMVVRPHLHPRATPAVGQHGPAPPSQAHPSPPRAPARTLPHRSLLSAHPPARAAVPRPAGGPLRLPRPRAPPARSGRRSHR